MLKNYNSWISNIFENLLILLFTVFLYIIFAALSFELALINGNAFSVWVPTGISLFLLTFLNKKTKTILLGIFAGAFFLNYFYIQNQILTSILIGVGNTLGSYLIYYFYKKNIKKNIFIVKEGKLTLFVFLIFMGAFISAFIGTLSLLLENRLYLETLVSIFSSWLIGDFMGFLIIFPILSFFLDKRVPKELHHFKYNKLKYKVLFIAFYSLVSIYIFVLPKDYEPTSLAFIAIILLFIPTNYISTGTTLLSILMMSFFAIVGIIFNFYHGSPFSSDSRENLSTGLILLQIYLATSVIIVYSLIIILYNKNKAILKLKKSNIKLRQTIHQSKQKDIILYKNSKKAFVGEMIDSIAHQWRQPLSEINSIIFKLDHHLIKKEKLLFLKNDLDRVELITTFLSETIDSFRDFIFLTKKKNSFSLNLLIENSINLFIYTFERNQINLKNNIDKALYINTYEKELAQIILSILQNSIEAFKRKNILENKIIKIDSYEENNFIYLTIKDNAGGVEQNNIDLILNQDFSSKKHNGGSGLYICNLLMKRLFKGDLNVRNTNDGLEVILKIIKEENK